MSTVQPGVKYPRDLPGYVGLPPGWKGVEFAYGSTSKSAGKTYIRFFSLNGKHRAIGSVRAAYMKHAEDQGLDPSVGERDFEAMRAREKEEKELAGRIAGERKEEAVAAFESKFGKLEAAVVPKIPGWTYVAKLVDSGQTHVTYFSPEGTSFGTVKAIEAFFGLRLIHRNDDDVSAVINAAREAFIREHGSLDPGYNPLRRSEDGSTLQDLVKTGQLDKVKEVEQRSSGPLAKRRKILPGDYLETRHLAVVSSPSNDLNAEGAGAERVLASLSQVKELLVHRGFRPDTQLLAVFGRIGGHLFVDSMAGVYYEMCEPIDGRPCFQWVEAVRSVSPVRLGCRALYICWRAAVGQWQVLAGSLDAMRASIVAFNTDNQSSLTDVHKPWMVIRQDFGTETKVV
mmetsp:Transcript_47121/g.108926  ORF Transcript_47121/g.108926 Transcript_47121/m.108926 type:complete len:399 (+) Transcript_47121:183-1379(+)|eukprot:CAMPEP_0171075316 /NCGR_PEP_ID=MMETSP0766_2-20121228/12705_1 /TAXON_ID=439317 /ORGANISM="Gambierdiscus australes, Strain CAWD 149" /LENGTH=398 /DNA_ID=CAMNT_0011532175 /DNA_START=93 /DNA_END=1289 /DNA_ORIENTATION=+